MSEPVSRPSVAKTLFLGILLPMRHLRLDRASHAGPAYFFRAFGLWCVLPMLLLHGYALIAADQNPSMWDFGDFNPNTILRGMPFQLLTGFVTVGLFAAALRAGLGTVGLPTRAATDSKTFAAINARVRLVGWYLGTALVSLVGWWFAISVFLISIQGMRDTVEDTTPIVMIILGIAALRVVVGGALSNLQEPDLVPETGVILRACFGCVLGIVYWFALMIPAGYVMRLILRPLILASIG